MKVVLLEDVKTLGKKGDVVEVNNGYAKNYILPKKLGVEANAKNLNDLKLHKQNEDKIIAEKLAKANELAEKLNDKTVSVFVKTGKNGKTFGSVTAKEIAEAVKKQIGVEIDKKKILLSDSIKILGTSEVTIKLHKDVIAKLNVMVSEK